MPTPAHGDIQIALSAEFNRTLNIIRIHTADDDCWMAINRAVPYPACAIVGSLARQNQLPVQGSA